MSPPSPALPPHRTLKIGTRGSPLALAQAELTRAALVAALPMLAQEQRVEVVVIRTTGDRVQDRPLAEIGGKGLFTKELEEALFDGRIDMAVHSMKDMETSLPEGLVVGAVLPRADVRDVLFGATSLATLPEGALVGTAALRRAAQILAARPDLRVVPLRGNVGTRLRKLGDGEVAATLLARAGLDRLGIEASVAGQGVGHAVLEPDAMLPAVAQGAVGLEVRADDAELLALLRRVDDGASHLCVRTERAMLAALDGSCRTPIAGLATLDGDGLTLEGLLAEPDGTDLRRTRRSGPATEPERLGHAVAAALRTGSCVSS